MMEIHLTAKTGERLICNVDYILSAEETRKGTLIRIGHFEKVYVQESFNEVVELIEQAKEEDIFPEFRKRKRPYQSLHIAIYREIA